MSDLYDKIEYVLQLCLEEQKKEYSYAYLPGICKTLERMKNIVENDQYDRAQREKTAGALGRLISDNYYFMVSELGTKLLNIADEFAPGK